MRQTQAQSLVLTPQLIQSIRLLQMNHLELERFIAEEVEKNPLLEHADTSGTDFSEILLHALSPASDTADDADLFPNAEPDFVTDTSNENDGGWLEDQAMPQDMSRDMHRDMHSAETLRDAFDVAPEDIYPDDAMSFDEGSERVSQLSTSMPSDWGVSSSGTGSGAGIDFDNFVQPSPSLAVFMREQLGLFTIDRIQRLIAEQLIEGLDENGYLRSDLGEISERLGIDISQIEAVLALMQQMEPAGVFARNLKECLSIQLRLQSRLDLAMERLLENLSLLAKRDFSALVGICGVGHGDLAEMLKQIRHLDPKPGSAFQHDMNDAIIPDIDVHFSRDGGFDIELTSAALPQVLIDEHYYLQLHGRADETEKEFLGTCFQNANWLTRSLDQRARTILKVAQAIIRFQAEFLRHGVTHLRPLALREVAEAVSLHESTVSRAIAGKFMQTPRGIFELSYFFSASLAASGGGDAHSAESVRYRIRQLIDAETVDNILSDDALVEALQAEGIEIARRTVAKYREAMHVASSVQRRREKKLQQS